LSFALLFFYGNSSVTQAHLKSFQAVLDSDNHNGILAAQDGHDKVCEYVQQIVLGVVELDDVFTMLVSVEVVIPGTI
jgi:hypothetical protein